MMHKLGLGLREMQVRPHRPHRHLAAGATYSLLKKITRAIHSHQHSNICVLLAPPKEKDP